MIPGMIGDFESIVIKLPELVGSHKVLLVFFTPFIIETADEKCCAEAQFFENRSHIFVLTDHGIIKSKNDCSHDNTFL
jgi:hypothetical protein